MWAGQTKFPGPVWRASPTLNPNPPCTLETLNSCPHMPIANQQYSLSSISDTIFPNKVKNSFSGIYLTACGAEIKFSTVSLQLSSPPVSHSCFTSSTFSIHLSATSSTTPCIPLEQPIHKNLYYSIFRAPSPYHQVS